MQRLALLTLAVAVTLSLGACRQGGKNGKAGNAAQTEQAEQAEQTTQTAQTPIAIAAVEKYFADEIAPQYAPGKFSIPVTVYAKTDESKPEDITVLGDFWILNYDQAGDTLKCVSGGNHAGKLHLKKLDDGSYAVTGYDRVEDGSNFAPSAKSIFGGLYEEFAAANANHQRRDSLIKCAVTDFVVRNGLDVNYFQDYGWPAVKIER